MAYRREQLWLTTGALVFALAHTQAPLYWSNQNQYFLHGLARAGQGHLDQDWLANTVDPTPIFSAAIEWIYRHAHEFVFYVVYAAILGLYFISLMSLAAAEPRGPRTSAGRLRLALGLIAIHAAIVRWGSVQLLDADYSWFLQAGIAGQYVLGPGLQPSVFGVFLVAAIAAFAQDRLVLTVLCVIAACMMHPTYLLPSALLTLGFMHVLWWENRRRDCLAFGAATLLAVLPVALDSFRRFAPTSPETFAEAQRILVEFRLPHHAVIHQWLDWIAVVQILWIVTSLVLIRKTRLFPVLLIAAIGALVLSLADVWTDTLALLFPWRLSAVLMPVATTIILARAITFFHPADAGNSSPRPEPLRRAHVILALLIAVVVAGSLAIQLSSTAYHLPAEEQPLYEFVRANLRPGDVYLLPIRVPNLSAGPRGSPSTTFVTRHEPAGENRVPIDLQRFRLATGAPIYVDFKSIPYKDVEVLEWRRRLELAVARNWTILKSAITHIVIPADEDVEPPGSERIYSGANYKVFRWKSG